MYYWTVCQMFFLLDYWTIVHMLLLFDHWPVGQTLVIWDASRDPRGAIVP